MIKKLPWCNKELFECDNQGKEILIRTWWIDAMSTNGYYNGHNENNVRKVYLIPSSWISYYFALPT